MWRANVECNRLLPRLLEGYDNERTPHRQSLVVTSLLQSAVNAAVRAKANGVALSATGGALMYDENNQLQTTSEVDEEEEETAVRLLSEMVDEDDQSALVPVSVILKYYLELWFIFFFI